MTLAAKRPDTSKDAIERSLALLHEQGLSLAEERMRALCAERDALLLAHPVCPTCGKPAVSNGVTGYCPHCQLVAATEKAEAETKLMRKLLIQTGRGIGCLLSDSVSTEFLGYLPEEARRLHTRASGHPAVMENIDLRAHLAALKRALRAADAELASTGYTLATPAVSGGKPREAILRALSTAPAPSQAAADVLAERFVGARERLSNFDHIQGFDYGAPDEPCFVVRNVALQPGWQVLWRGTDHAAMMRQCEIEEVKLILAEIERLDRAADQSGGATDMIAED